MNMICIEQHSHEAQHRTQTSSKNWEKYLNQYHQHSIKHTQQNKQTHVRTLYYSNHKNNSQIKKTNSKSWDMKWERENPYLFFEDLRMKWCKNGSLFESDTVSLRVFQIRKTMNSHRSSREKLKTFKVDLFVQNTRFSWLNQVTCKSLEPAARTLERKTFEKFSKCF